MNAKLSTKMEKLASPMMRFLEGHGVGNTSSKFNYELDDSFLLEYMDYLDKNLNDVLICMHYLKILKENRLLKQVKIIQKKMRFLRYLYATKINGYVDHEKLECLEARILFMANNVGQFCLAVSVNDENYLNECEDCICAPEDDILHKPPYLLCLIVLVELEMKKIFFG
ncbi:hypothetical protein HAX54_035165 [Datura stramonium]|uniref:Uncharacterized protein n=1 Tax=Datura stramonium TaxID=4076 RepID=A0ABS8VIR7_DATST|nr:hypothetical protein [Datura stramonium]